MRRALVTGGSGFIGTHLVAALRTDRCEVTILDTTRPDVNAADRSVLGSVTDRGLVETAVNGADVVFHLAGMLGTTETIERAHETTQINVLGTLNVLDAARKSGASVVFVTKPNYWRNPYSITKVAAEHFSLMYRELFGMDVRIARCYNVYGPGQHSEEEGVQKAVPTFILRALRNEKIVVYGDGTREPTTFSFLTLSER